MIKHIPNTITCLNLLCGCIGIVKVSQGDLVAAAYLIAIAIVLDFLDGFAARMLNAYSAIGKDLDSLADGVTFGVLPSLILHHYLVINLANSEFQWFANGAFFIAIFSILRLAKFNNDPRQSDGFIGLPTPANAILIASFPLIAENYPSISLLLTNSTYLLVFVALMSYLLVAELPLLAFKFKKWSWIGNEARYVVILGSVLLLFAFQVAAVPFILVLYIGISVFLNSKKKTV